MRPFVRRIAWLLALMVAPSLTGCLYLSFGDDYARNTFASREEGRFAPDFFLKQNATTIPLVPLMIRVERAPHDLEMLKFDQTFHASHKGFREFVIESLEIQFEDEAPTSLIGTDMPLAERTFAIPSNLCGEDATRVFRKVVTQRKSFQVLMRGFAVRDDGEQVPFTRRAAWRYDGRKRSFETWFDVIANV